MNTHPSQSESNRAADGLRDIMSRYDGDGVGATDVVAFVRTNLSALTARPPGYQCDPSDIVLKMDGNAWCAHRGDFVNLQESPAAFGDTPAEAVATLSNAK